MIKKRTSLIMMFDCSLADVFFLLLSFYTEMCPCAEGERRRVTPVILQREK